MDFSYKQAPLFRLVLAFIAGIVISISNIQIVGTTKAITVIVLVFVASALGAVFSRSASYKNRWVFGASLSLLMISLGALTVIVNTEKLQERHISTLREGKYPFIVQVIEGPQEKANTYRFLVEVECVKQYGKCEPRSGKVLLYLAKDSSSANIKYGDKLLGEGYIETIDGPENPGEFDYKKYMDYQQVQRKVMLYEGQWKLLGDDGGNPLKAFVYRLRERMLKVLQSSGLSEESYGVASALVLGYKDALDGDIIKAYVGAGAIHVLAVSGLHVGVIYIILMFFLKRLGQGRRFALLKVIIIISFLVTYGMLTGMPPSVSRAIIMFSCIAIADSFRFQTNIYNTLSFSALVVTLIDPYALMQVGFQLSYLAVAGISYLYPRIYEVWAAPNKAVDWLWQITCVSLAAQVATFPLVLFYFHQFAVYFLLSGPIVILGATVTIWLGLSLLVTSCLPLLPLLLSTVLDRIIYFMNKSVTFIETLPLSVIKGIDISLLETWLVYGAIVLLLVWFASRSVKWLYGFLALLLLISTLQLREAIHQSRQQLFVVYNVSNGTLAALVNGRKVQVFGDRDLFEDGKKMEYHIKPHWWQLGINEVEFISLDSLTEYETPFQTFGLSVVGKNNKYRNVITTGSGEELLLLYDSPDASIKSLARYYDFDKVIFDASNSYKNTKKWTRQCKREKISFYNTAESGAYLLDISGQ